MAPALKIAPTPLTFPCPSIAPISLIIPSGNFHLLLSEEVAFAPSLFTSYGALQTNNDKAHGMIKFGIGEKEHAGEAVSDIDRKSVV